MSKRLSNKILYKIKPLSKDVIIIINEFLGNVEAYLWSVNNIKKCRYCNCPLLNEENKIIKIKEIYSTIELNISDIDKKIDINKEDYCSFPFICYTLINYDDELIDIIDEKNMEMINLLSKKYNINLDYLGPNLTDIIMKEVSCIISLILQDTFHNCYENVSFKCIVFIIYFVKNLINDDIYYLGKDNIFYKLFIEVYDNYMIKYNDLIYI